MNATSATAPGMGGGMETARHPFYRWGQLIFGIICMAMIANSTADLTTLGGDLCGSA